MGFFDKPKQCDLTGKVVDGDTMTFSVSKRIGSGGFGDVYKAKTTDGNDCALKILRLWNPEIKMPDTYRKRFYRAYELMREDNKHLISAIDKGEVDGNPFYVMPFLKRGDLYNHFDKVVRSKREMEVARCMYETAQGLYELHSRGMVHRDLKPDNVMLDDDGNILLNDFDLCGDSDNRITMYIAGVPMGVGCTYGFAPPEQENPYRDKKDVFVMPTIDIFAFGVMTYLLLTNNMPFGTVYSASDRAVYYANVNNDKWDRDALQGLQYYSFWIQLLEPCLKGDYHNRLNNTKTIIELFEKQFPQLSDGKKEVKKYPRMTDYGLSVIYGEATIKNNSNVRYGVLNADVGILTLGRFYDGVQNDINIYNDQHRFISRRHATLEWDNIDCHWYIRDGQYDKSTRSWSRSKNGTYVNSREVDGTVGARLEVDDIIYLGDMRLRVDGYDEKGWMYYGGQKHKNPIWT